MILLTFILETIYFTFLLISSVYNAEVFTQVESQAHNIQDFTPGRIQVLNVELFDSQIHNFYSTPRLIS